MAEQLGFEGLMWNSMSVVGDRGFVLEAFQWGLTLVSHMSRWSEDLIVYLTGEIGFVRLADAYSTGSSLMPQKKLPDRLTKSQHLASAARNNIDRSTAIDHAQRKVVSMPTVDRILIVPCVGGGMIPQCLLSTYNKDLQEPVELILDYIKTVRGSV